MLEIAGTLSALKGALDLAKAASDARDAARIDSALADISARLLDTQGLALGLTEQLRRFQLDLHAAEEKARQLEAAAKDRAAHALKEIRPGAFAYAAKPEADGGQGGQYYLCQPCYDKQLKSMLRYSPGSDWVNGQWTCPESDKHTIENTAAN